MTDQQIPYEVLWYDLSLDPYYREQAEEVAKQSLNKLPNRFAIHLTNRFKEHPVLRQDPVALLIHAWMLEGLASTPDWHLFTNELIWRDNDQKRYAFSTRSLKNFLLKHGYPLPSNLYKDFNPESEKKSRIDQTLKKDSPDTTPAALDTSALELFGRREQKKQETQKQYVDWQSAITGLSRQYPFKTHSDLCRIVAKKTGRDFQTIRRNTRLKKKLSEKVERNIPLNISN